MAKSDEKHVAKDKKPVVKREGKADSKSSAKTVAKPAATHDGAPDTSGPARLQIGRAHV